MVGSFFAELGARVIKVENKRSNGDATRQWKLPNEDPSAPFSAYYASANYGKELLLLNLKDEKDYDHLTSLVLQSDVILSNALPHIATKLRIDYDSIKAIHPNSIYAQLIAYEPDDPRPGYDLVMQAETGFMSMNGDPDGDPSKMPVALIDVMAGHQLKEAILIALLNRKTTGKGCYIRVSLYQSAIASLANQASNYLMEGHIPKRMGSLHPNISPYGDSFVSQDGVRFMLAIGSDAQFEKLVNTLDSPALSDDIFAENMGRLKNRTKLCRTLQKCFDARSFNHISVSFVNASIPFCRINDISQVFDNHLAAEMIKEWSLENYPLRSVSQLAFEIIEPDKC